jgi:hypothetical protein
VKNAMPCHVCRKSNVESDESIGTSTNRVKCPRCGVYDIALKLKALDKDGAFLNNRERLALCHAIRRATDAHGRFAEPLLADDVKALIERHPLPDPVDQADLLIDIIGRSCLYGELTEEATTDVWAARLGLKGVNQIKDLYRDLAPLIRQSGLGAPDKALPAVTTLQFGLTLEGYRRYREIRQQRGPGNQAFVAMWFHADMKPAFDDGFARALLDTGHQPYRVDLAAHNNKIDDQIVAEIRRSKLVIVDTTGARPNAYFEAGFALGLGIPVIWCCSDSPRAPGLTSGTWTDNLPFDIRQHAFTFWSNPADLKEKLTARIRALGFDAEWNRGER